MKKRYRASYMEPEWFKKESDALLEEYMNTETDENEDLECFVRKHGSPEYIKELDYALSVL